jgi:two-component system, OmpR family, sensor histidine kinase KdpD
MNESMRADSKPQRAGMRPQETRGRRGKLRIFLGYVAGVGKTYAMLDAARQQQSNGVDVAIATVETHGRAETELLAHGLEVSPSRPIDVEAQDVEAQDVEAQGVSSTEMDLDAVLARRPALVLVDELAHDNAPGSRHPKRYQDVEELLDAGIDVYTTLNIQNLESLHDVVKQITGMEVEETVPDRILETADDIELVDLPTDELLRRLEEGKVHVPNLVAPGARKFFRPGNLNALRELALRRAAERVDMHMRSYMQTEAIVGPWPANERVLVCVSPSPLSERLVRATFRLATRLDAEWHAVYVATPEHASLSEQDRDRVAATLRLAERLGAKAITMSATSIVDGIVTYASRHNINRIVAGKPLRPRWRELFRGSLADQIIRRAKDIDVYIISTTAIRNTPQVTIEEAAGTLFRQRAPFKLDQRYLWSILIVALITVVGLPIRGHVEPTNMVMLYLMGIVITALQWGRGPSTVASLLSILAFDIFFIPPYDTLIVRNAEYLLTFMGLFVVGLVVSTLAARTGAHAAAAHEREEQAVAAFELSYDLATALTIQEIMARAVYHTQRVFGVAVAIYRPTGTPLSLQHATTDYDADSHADKNDRAAIDWAFQHRQPAGAGTDTLTAARVRALPLITVHNVVGVLALVLPPGYLLPPQRRLLESFANQIALALERAQLAEAANELRVVQEREKFQSALLGSISHDLRTPLVTITGALSALQEQGTLLQPSARHALVATAHEQATRLNQLVGNLLDMSRLEGGAVHVRRELCDLQDLVGVALERNAPALAQHRIALNVPDSLPLIPVDFVLMVQVLANLIDNAAKYSPAQTTIAIEALIRDQIVEISVADEGIGIPDQELTHIFDKFHRVTHGDNVVGTGLGLSISKGLVEAHGGRIWAENRAGGGSIFTVSLPLHVASSTEKEATQ